MLKKIHTPASREFRPPMSTAFHVQEPFRGVTEPRPTQNLVAQIRVGDRGCGGKMASARLSQSGPRVAAPLLAPALHDLSSLPRAQRAPSA